MREGEGGGSTGRRARFGVNVKQVGVLVFVCEEVIGVMGFFLAQQRQETIDHLVQLCRVIRVAHCTVVLCQGGERGTRSSFCGEQKALYWLCNIYRIKIAFQALRRASVQARDMDNENGVL